MRITFMPRWISVIPSENEEAITLIEWVKTRYLIRDYFIHIVNEGKRSPFMGKLLKKMGMMKGVSDYFLAIPNGDYHGLWIELKRVKHGRVSEEQLDWITKMNNVGYHAQIAFGADHAIRIINQYLDGQIRRGIPCI